jgi:hypothetical protein
MPPATSGSPHIFCLSHSEAWNVQLGKLPESAHGDETIHHPTLHSVACPSPPGPHNLRRSERPTLALLLHPDNHLINTSTDYVTSAPQISSTEQWQDGFLPAVSLKLGQLRRKCSYGHRYRSWHKKVSFGSHPLYVNRAEGIAVEDVDGVWSSADDGVVSEVQCMDGCGIQFLSRCASLGSLRF